MPKAPPPCVPTSPLDDILGRPGRDAQPGLRPVVHFRRGSDATLLEELERRYRFSAALERRGVDHGCIAELKPLPSQPGPLSPAKRFAMLRDRWNKAMPIVLPAIVSGALDAHRAGIRVSLELMKRMRRGGDLARLLARPPYPARLGGGFLPAGSTHTAQDPREIQKVHFDGGLYVKANWLSTSPGDDSLRLRVSFGVEVVDDWKEDRRGTLASCALADRLFPESAALTRNRPLLGLLARLTGAPVEFTQRIYYANAPGGGALFHHDFVPRQRGVAYAQLAGSTGWLSCSKRFLAERIERHVVESPRRARGVGPALRRLVRDRRALLDSLDDARSELTHDLINHSPAFTARLVDDGVFRILRPGDAILLPSHGWDRVAWHSVFCWDQAPSLSLSFAIRNFQKTSARGEANARSRRTR